MSKVRMSLTSGCATARFQGPVRRLTPCAGSPLGAERTAGHAVVAGLAGDAENVARSRADTGAGKAVQSRLTAVLIVSAWLSLPCITLAQSVQTRPEPAYVAPQATVRLADGPRKALLGGGTGKKFADAADRDGRQVTLSNPYLDPAKFFFANPDAIQCKADGGLVVASRAALDAQARATAVGYWNVAPDGAVTPLHTRSTAAPGKTSITVCNAPYGQAIRLRTSRFAIDADGSLITAEHHGVMKIGPDGPNGSKSHVRRLAGSPLLCEGMGSPGIRGFADGPADQSRFDNDGHGGANPAVAADGQGNVYTVDQAGCTLRRIAADGSVSTVLRREQVCTGAPPDRILLAELAWDAGRNELVSGGDVLTHNQVFTTVWRIRPDGQARRVLLAHKVGSKSPAGVQLDGLSALAVDAQGRIHIASRVMPTDHQSRARGSDEIGVMRVDEAQASVLAVTGAKLPAWGHGQALALDGPVQRATFKKMQGMCFAPDGTLYVLDELTVRRIDRQGQVSTWVY